MQDKDENYWKEKLTPEQYKILREKGTEAPFTGKYYQNHEDGMYYCAACNHPLFSSTDKYDSGSGWPSFTKPLADDSTKTQDDYGILFSQRTEVICQNCGSHLGHVFDDGPKESTGKRFCINSAALNFKPEK